MPKRAEITRAGKVQGARGSVWRERVEWTIWRDGREVPASGVQVRGHVTTPEGLVAVTGWQDHSLGHNWLHLEAVHAGVAYWLTLESDGLSNRSIAIRARRFARTLVLRRGS